MDKQKELFDSINQISSKIHMLGGIVQNPYTPTDLDPAEFRDNVNQCVTELKQWEKDVSDYYRNMSPETIEEIKQLQQLQ